MGEIRLWFIHSQTANLVVMRETVAVQAVTGNVAYMDVGAQPYNSSLLPSESAGKLYTIE